MSLADADRRALEQALGPGALADAAVGPVDVDVDVDVGDGERLDVVLRPADPEALAAALRELSGRGLTALVRGGGTRSALGNLPEDSRCPDLVLSTEGLVEAPEIDVEEGVARFAAGTRVADAAAALGDAALGDAGWELPLEAVGAASSVGGALASAAPMLRFGAVRDVVLGLDVVLASGSRTRCGGRVVKNVTGYDLVKLQLGALGSLGVIASAWLRLRPRPECVRAWRLPDIDADDVTRLLALSRLPSVRAALHVPEDGLFVELAGDAPAVDHDAARLQEQPGPRDTASHEIGPEEIDAAWSPVHDAADDDELRFRIDFRPSRLAALAQAVAAAGGGWRALPARGLGWASFRISGADRASMEASISKVARAADAAGGSWRLEAAPPEAKRGRDVFGALGAAGPIMRAVKRQFDPDGVLNPGRIAGPP